MNSIQLIDGYTDKILGSYHRVSVLRDLCENLTEQLAYDESDESLLIGLFYKSLSQDLLSNAFEDDYLPREYSNALLENFAHGLAAVHGSWSQRARALAPFIKLYKSIGQIRTSPLVVGVGEPNFKVQIKDTQNGEFNIADGFNVFSNLDINIANPQYARHIIDSYSSMVAGVQNQLKSNGGELDLLCFVEKAYSVVGALPLLSSLVTETDLPAVIYRSSYWVPEARVSGVEPWPGATACLVYDMVVGGQALSRAANDLRDQFQVSPVAAVVYFEYDQPRNGTPSARDVLSESGIDLFSYRRHTEIRKDLETKENFIDSLLDLESIADLDSRIEQAEEAVHALKAGRTR